MTGKPGKTDFFDIAYDLKTSDEARAMYDRWAEVYDQDLTGKEYQQPARCAAALKDTGCLPDAKVLDVGCGTGLSGMALADAGYNQIDGCDISPGMLEKAGALGVYGRLFACDLNVPPIDATDEAYDAVTAVGVFSFGHILPDAVEELLRVAKPGAAIIIGLNDHYYQEGSLNRKLDQLADANRLKIVNREHGEHIPGNDLTGWVITLTKA